MFIKNGVYGELLRELRHVGGHEDLLEEGGSLRAVVSVDKDGLGGGLVLVSIDDEDVTVGAEDLWEVGDDGDGLGLQSLLAQYVGGGSGGPTGLVLDGLLLSLGGGGLDSESDWVLILVGFWFDSDWIMIGF